MNNYKKKYLKYKKKYLKYKKKYLKNKIILGGGVVEIELETFKPMFYKNPDIDKEGYLQIELRTSSQATPYVEKNFTTEIYYKKNEDEYFLKILDKKNNKKVYYKWEDEWLLYDLEKKTVDKNTCFQYDNPNKIQKNLIERLHRTTRSSSSYEWNSDCISIIKKYINDEEKKKFELVCKNFNESD